jgi:hypothetical protein
MKRIDEEITTLALTKEIDPVPQVRTAAHALLREIQAKGPLAGHLEPSLHLVSRQFGWEIAQEARFLIRDLNLGHSQGRKAA